MEQFNWAVTVILFTSCGDQENTANGLKTKMQINPWLLYDNIKVNKGHNEGKTKIESHQIKGE